MKINASQAKPLSRPNCGQLMHMWRMCICIGQRNRLFKRQVNVDSRKCPSIFSLLFCTIRMFVHVQHFNVHFFCNEHCFFRYWRIQFYDFGAVIHWWMHLRPCLDVLNCFGLIFTLWECHRCATQFDSHIALFSLQFDWNCVPSTTNWRLNSSWQTEPDHEMSLLSVSER